MAEKKYLDSEKVIKLLRKDLICKYPSPFAHRLWEAADEIAKMDGEDVRPVIKAHKVTRNRPIAGHWVSGKLDGGVNGMEGTVFIPPVMINPVDYCSWCGKRLDDTFQHFCPNCGAEIILESVGATPVNDCEVKMEATRNG